MPKCVVVGGGPIGLYLAIKLKQMEVDVAVVDHRLGEATRPGTIDEKVFELLTQNIGQEVKASESDHIKDIERGLHAIAKKLGVVLIKQKFTQLVPDGIEVEDAEQLQRTRSYIPCSLLFDATGPARAVLESVNDVTKTNVFAAERFADNPIKHNFIAYVRMDASDSAALEKPLAAQIDPLQHTLALEVLRSQFGWQEYAEPQLYSRVLNKGKVCLYCTTPPGLAKENEEAWLRALLRLKTGKSDIDFQHVKPSTKYKSKPRFLPFIVDPKKVTTAIFSSEKHFPTVVPVGDAQIEPEYQIGIGVTSGINRVDAFMSSISIDAKENNIMVDVVKYREKLLTLMSEHENRIKKFYTRLEKKFIDAIVIEEERYKTAFELVMGVQQKKQIAEPLAELLFRRAKMLYIELLSGVNKAFKLNHDKEITSVVQLDNVILRLRDALKIIQPSQEVLKNKVGRLLIDIAENCADLANVYANEWRNRYEDCKNFFKRSLDIYQEYFPIQKREEIKKIYFSLVKASYERGAYVDAIAYANDGLSHINKTMQNDFSVLTMKIALYQCLALLDQANSDVTPINIAKNNVEKAKQLAIWLNANSKMYKQDQLKIQKKIELFNKRLDVCYAKQRFFVGCDQKAAGKASKTMRTLALLPIGKK